MLDATALTADCSACEALCCVVSTFVKGADFPHDKPSGRACKNLGSDFRCTAHTDLRKLGYAGCVAFDCYGAGQRLTAEGRTASLTPDAFFGAIRGHQTLWLLREALSYDLSEGLAARCRTALERLWAGALDAAEPDADALTLLRDAGAELRGVGPDHAGVMWFGRDLRTTDLRDANLRGAVLVATRLDGCDLGRADLTGADLRGASVAGADLSRVLFMHPSQLSSMRGDGETRLPPGRTRPEHW